MVTNLFIRSCKKLAT